MLDLYKIEEIHRNNLQKHDKSISNKFLLFKYVDFFNELLKFDDKSVLEAYVSESIININSLLSELSIEGITQQQIDRIIYVLKEILGYSFSNSQARKLENNISRIENENNELKDILKGKICDDSWSRSTPFPLIEITKPVDSYFGSTDTVSVLLNKNKNISDDEFLVVPSLPKLDKELDEQIRLSWMAAKRIISENTDKQIPKFNVVIEFKRKHGIYIGRSNGIALTLTFICELGRYLNIRLLRSINKTALFTGLVDEDGNVNNVNEDSIKVKTKLAFYSKYKYLVVSQGNGKIAEDVLAQEKIKYPNRELNIIPVNDINTILQNDKLLKSINLSPLTYYKNGIIKHKYLFVTVLFVFLLFFGFTYVNIFNKNSEIDVPDHDFVSYAKTNFNFKEEKLSMIEDMNEIFHLSFDEVDLEENGNSTIQNYSNIEKVENRFNETQKAVLFNGEDSYIRLKNDKSLQIDFPISVSFWIKKIDDGQGGIFNNSYDERNYNGVFFLFTTGNTLSMHFGNGQVIGRPTSRRSAYLLAPMELYRWTHVVGQIISPDDMRLFINTKKSDIYYSGEAENIVYNDGLTHFGKSKNSLRFDDSFFHFRGVLDDFRMFDRVLSENEINRLFHER